MRKSMVIAIVSLAVVIVSVALVIGVAGGISVIEWYRTDSPTTVTVTVITSGLSWARITDVQETETSVTVTVRNLEIGFLPQTSVGHRKELTVTLASPLGQRTIFDGTGDRVPEESAQPP